MQDHGRPRRRHGREPAGARARGRTRRQRLAGGSIPESGAGILWHRRLRPGGRTAAAARGGSGQGGWDAQNRRTAPGPGVGGAQWRRAAPSQAWLTRLLGALGAFTEGRRHGEEALHLATLAGRGNTPIVAPSYIGHLYLAQGDLEPAIRVLEQGVA